MSRILAGLALLPILSATALAEDPAEPVEAQVSAPSELLLPHVDFYFPEGELNFRLNGLIKGSFYEGQIRYNFVDADIEAFLRYRYYGYSRIFQLEVFDSLEFDPIEKGSNDFERVRGGFFLIQWPRSYQQRIFVLVEVDTITSNKEEFVFTTDKTNTFLRLGYQLGTPDDVRSNAILGNRRASIQNLFTAHRRIGPHGAGLTTAMTYGLDFGDFNYLRAEIETLKRFEVSKSGFLIARAHAGTFFSKRLLRDDPEILPSDRYSIPREELFRLDGRENLKGLDERRRCLGDRQSGDDEGLTLADPKRLAESVPRDAECGTDAGDAQAGVA